MAGEDRVLTTEMLAGISRSSYGELGLPIGVSERLDPNGMHVLVPTGHVHGPGEPTLRCQAQLAEVGTPEPLCAEVLVSAQTFDALPSAFDVLHTAVALISGVADHVDVELASLVGSDDQDVVPDSDQDIP